MGYATLMYVNRVPSLSSNQSLFRKSLLQFYFNPDLYIQVFGNRKGRGTVSITPDPYNPGQFRFQPIKPCRHSRTVTMLSTTHVVILYT